MMPQWLLDRLLAETPDLTPEFSLRNSARWVRALRILVQDGTFEDDSLRAFYANVQRRRVSIVADNLVFESTLMSLHYLASLRQLVAVRDLRYCHMRSAVIVWYYGVYYAAIAMLAAADGGVHQTHAGNARAWGRQIRDNGLVCGPFAFGLSTLVKSECDSELAALRGGNQYHLNDDPVNAEAALGGCISYLKGTADRERELAEKAIMSETQFRALGLPNFRTKRARFYRDAKLAGRSVNFLHQAFRYRGKANYRDAIFMAYGQRQQDWLDDLGAGLEASLDAFARMAAHYCSRRTERGSWASFCADLEDHALIELPAWVRR